MALHLEMRFNDEPDRWHFIHEVQPDSDVGEVLATERLMDDLLSKRHGSDMDMLFRIRNTETGDTHE